MDVSTTTLIFYTHVNCNSVFKIGKSGYANSIGRYGDRRSLVFQYFPHLNVTQVNQETLKLLISKF